MSIIQVTGSGGKAISDRTLFTGARVPPEIKTMVKCLKNVKKPTFIKLLQIAVSDLEGKEISTSDFNDEVITGTLNEETTGVLYSGLYSLLTLALRVPTTSIKPETFKEDLQELKIPQEFIPLISSAVFGSKRPVIDEKISQNRPRLPRLDGLNWRVDVAISTSSLNRVLEPTVSMEMTLSDGKIHNFEQRIVNSDNLQGESNKGAERIQEGLESCNSVGKSLETVTAGHVDLGASSFGSSCLIKTELSSEGMDIGCAEMNVSLVDITKREPFTESTEDGAVYRNEATKSFITESDEKLVQVRANKQEIDRRINSFIQRKRMEVDEINRREFCGHFVSDLDPEFTSCARTDAVFHPSSDGKSHVKVWRVVNPWGPQTRISATGDGKQPSGVNITTNALNERLENLEKHLKLSPVKPGKSKDVYTRIRSLEDRVLYLESLSPEYFSETPLKKYRSASHIEKEPIEPYSSENQPESLSLFEIDQRIKSLQESLRQKSQRK